MIGFKIKIEVVFVLVFFANIAFGQKETLNSDRSILIIGKWVNKIDKTLDGKKYTGLNCRDTIQYMSKGKYISKQCVWDETGEWKLSIKGDKIIKFNIDNKYWKEKLATDDLGESHCEIISISDTELVTKFFSESEGEIHQFYVKI